MSSKQYWEKRKEIMAFDYVYREYRRRFKKSIGDWRVYPRRLVMLFKLVLEIEEEVRIQKREKRQKIDIKRCGTIAKIRERLNSYQLKDRILEANAAGEKEVYHHCIHHGDRTRSQVIRNGIKYGKIQYKCRACRRAIAKKHYQENRSKIAKKHANYKKRKKRELLNEIERSA